jgi:hypothetical protein
LTGTADSPNVGARPAPAGPARFSLAANYDPELVPALAAYPVDEVYGKFPADGVSGGRPRYLATPLSDSDLRGYIRLLARLGELGVSRLTVSTPFLLEWVKRRFPEFKVKVGIYAQVDTPACGDSPGGAMRPAADCQPRLPAELSDAGLSPERLRACVG